MVFPALGPVRRNELGKFLMISPFAHERMAVAQEVLGYHLADALLEGDDDYSEAVQLAFFVACLSLADLAEQRHGVAPEYCAGPSFGERTALVYTGALTYPEGLRLVELIARIEHEYFAVEHTGIVTHSFVRVSPEQLKGLLSGLEAQGEWYDVSGYLDQDFSMVSLHERALPAFKAAISACGGYSMSTMRPPAHAGVFGELRERIAREIDARFVLRPPRIPVVSYQDGVLLDDPAALRSALLDGFVKPIRWLDTVRSLQGLGVEELCFAGPDSMFHRLRSTVDSFEVDLVDVRRVLRPPRR
jgi:[acyl-carrier-protein] S-malonyltransferase